MVTITLTDDQVIALVRQLPPETKRSVLLALTTDSAAQRDRLREYTGGRLKEVASARNLDWDGMGDDQRLSLVDDLVHEVRVCGQ
jgi:hypothetical protein